MSVSGTPAAVNDALLRHPPSCRVYHSVDVSIAHSTLTILGQDAGVTAVFDSERWDTDGMHSTVTNPGRITFNTAGLYHVFFSWAPANATDYTQIWAEVMLNAATGIARQVQAGNTGNSSQGISVSTVYKFAAGDYVVARIRHINTAVAARNMSSAVNYTPEFGVVWVGDAA